MSRILFTIDIVEKWLIALLTGTALLVACLAMLARYVIPGLLLDWTFEVTIFTVIWAMFLAGARIAGQGQHVHVDTLLNVVPLWARKNLVVFAGFTGIVLGIVLVWSGTIVVAQAVQWDERTTSSLRLPLWIYYLSLPVGAALLVFHLIVRTTLIAAGRVSAEVVHHGD